MHTHNQFSIDIERQKTRAKKLLKSIRNGDKEALIQVQKYQNKPAKITSENAQLADIQFAIARELGLPSWSKLKKHVQEQALHQKAIETNEPALDAEMSTLHVRCGHDIQARLKEAGFNGEFLPLIDPLCIGPIPSDEKSFIAIRAAYVADTLFPIMGNEGKTEDVAKAEYNNVKTLLDSKFERVVFWVEHDSYDQLMLLRAMNLLADNTEKTIEIIELSEFPGSERFVGMGQLPAHAIRSCWKNRRTVNGRLMSQARSAWNAFRDKTPANLISLFNQHTFDCLPNLSRVIERHLQELPHSVTGLSMTQYHGLSVLLTQQTSITFKDWFQAYQKCEPLPFLGDIMFYALMMPLCQSDKPLFVVKGESEPYHNRTVAITQEGIDCLSGKSAVLTQYWVGGIAVDKKERWSWDHQDLNSIQHQINTQ